MKIAILTNAFPPDGLGGAERIAWFQAEMLAFRGHDVRVWAPSDDRTWKTQEEDQERGESNAQRSVIEGGIHRAPPTIRRFASSFASLNDSNPVLRLFFHLSDLLARTGVAQAIIDWKPDVLISHNLTGCGIGTPRRVAKFQIPNSKFRWIHILHDVQLAEPSGQVRSQQSSNQAIKQLCLKLWRRCWSLTRLKFFGSPDVMVSPSQWLLDWHRRYEFRGSKEMVLPNPVEIGERVTRSRYEPATIVYVGRMAEEKGFGDLLRAIPSLDLSLVGSCILIGDGPQRSDISLLNDPRIDYRGSCSNEDVHKAIAQADLLVMPSRIEENQPTVIIEAMSEGTPVIATAVGGVPEMLDGTGASLIPVDDDLAKHLISEMKTLLSDAARWSAISIAERQRAEQRHGMKGYVEALERVIASGAE